MSSVEAAASLFGPEDLSSDPFAALGDTADASPSLNSAYDQFYNHENDNDSASSNSRGHQNVFGTQQDTSAPVQPWPEPLPIEQHGYDTLSYPENESRNWNHEQGQHVYEPLPAQTGMLGTSNAFSTTVRLFTSKICRTGLFWSSGLFHSAEHIRSLHAMQTQSPYEPYKPAVQPFSSNYSPSVPTSSPQPRYDPYKPTAPTFQSPSISQTLTSQSYPIPFSSKATATTAIPPPPAPAAVLNRPKLLNAYDPPFPTSKPAKRNLGRSVVQPASNMVGHQSYSTHSPHTAALSPSVPAGGSTTASLPRGVEYLDHSRGLGFNVPPTHHDGWSPPQTNPSYNVHPAGAVYDGVRNSPSGYAGVGNSPHIHQQAARPPPQGSFNDRTVSQAPAHYQPFDDIPLPAPSSFSYFGGTGDSTGDKLNMGTSNNHVLGSSSPPKHPGLRENNVYEGQHYTSPPAPPRVTSPGDRFYTQPQDSELSSQREPNVQHSSNPSSVGETGVPNASPPTHSRNGSGSSERYSIPQNTNSVDDPTAFPSRRTLSPDVYSSNEFQDAQPVQNDASDPYQPASAGGVKTTSPATEYSRTGARNGWPDPYAPMMQNQASEPEPAFDVNRAASPGTQSSYAHNGIQNARPHPPFTTDPVMHGDVRDRSMSTSSVYSSISTSTEDRYAPSQHRHHQPSEPSNQRRNSLRYSYPKSQEAGLVKPPLPYEQVAGQELLVNTLTQMPYAPSPSLMGSNDPLGRTTARVPVFSFGFSGKLVTCFHGSSVLNTGFDVALSSRRSMDVNIRVLSKIIPESVLDISSSSFPGPLFSDPGTPTGGLVRSGIATQIKTKKARISKYLEDRAEEISRGIGYLHSGSVDRRKLEGKLVLVKLLKVMVENDGRLSGSYVPNRPGSYSLYSFHFQIQY